jgi:pimeloyl-ACP methyl ester carboxylesterase
LNIDSCFIKGHWDLAGDLFKGAAGEDVLEYFTASDGAAIAYRDHGAGMPLVFLHGLMANGGFFQKQDALSSDFRLINIELRGHGGSAGAGGSPTVERIGADVAELAESLDLRQAIGIGWSLGATVLWHVLAGQSGKRFRGAVVVDMTARVRNGEEWDLGLSPEACEARTAAIKADFQNFATAAGQAIFSQPVAPPMTGLADWASREFSRNDPVAIAAVWESLMRQDMRSLLKKISHPTLIVHGAQSSLYGDDTAAHLVAALPNARAVRFEHSGHAPHLEQPELFNRTLKDFADRLSRGRAHEAIDIQGEMS